MSAVWVQSFLPTHPFLQFQQNEELQRIGLVKHSSGGGALTLSFWAILLGTHSGLCPQHLATRTNAVSGNIVRNGKLRDNEDEIFQLMPPHFSVNLSTRDQKAQEIKISLKEQNFRAHFVQNHYALGGLSSDAVISP